MFVLKTNLTEDRWIRSVDFRPAIGPSCITSSPASMPRAGAASSTRVTRAPAILIWVDSAPACRFRRFCRSGPPAKPRYCPEGTGYMLPKGADILIQVHYHKSGKPETDATSVGLYFSKKPLPRKVHTGFVFPNLSFGQAIAAEQKFAAAKKAGRILPFSIDQRLHGHSGGRADYEVKASTKPGSSMMGRPLAAISSSLRSCPTCTGSARTSPSRRCCPMVNLASR